MKPSTLTRVVSLYCFFVKYFLFGISYSEYVCVRIEKKIEILLVNKRIGILKLQLQQQVLKNGIHKNYTIFELRHFIPQE